jgi:hypothetical protein
MNTLTFLNKLNDKSLGAVRSALYGLSIKTGYDKEGRIILFPESRGDNIIGKMNNEANGLILHNPAWIDGYKQPASDLKVLDGYKQPASDLKILDGYDGKISCLAVPMPYLRNSGQMNKQSITDEWNANTTVYPCREGTNVVVYYFQPKDKWCMATAKGIEVNDLYWNGNKTYQEMFMECVQETNSEIKSFDEFCSHLDKNYSFCLGFWHPDFHVFLDQKPTFWVNKIVDNRTFKDVTSECKVKIFNVVQACDFKNSYPEEIMKDLESQTDSALERYLTDQKNQCLGYMIRGLNNGDVLLESKLQKTINDLYYNASYTKSITATSYNRHNYVLLTNYVNGNNELFVEIFPRFADDYERFAKDIEKLIENLKLLYRKSKQRQKLPITLNKYTQLANEIKKNIDKLIKVNVDDKLFRMTVTSVLFHPNHFDTLYQLLFN